MKRFAMPESEVVPMELYTVTSSPIPTNIVSATRDIKSSI